MEIIIVIAAIIAIAVLAPFFGTDSRDLRDHDWEDRPGRRPRPLA